MNLKDLLEYHSRSIHDQDQNVRKLSLKLEVLICRVQDLEVKLEREGLLPATDAEYWNKLIEEVENES